MTHTTRMPVARVGDDDREDYESSERGEWELVGDIAAQRAQWADLARATLDGRRRRISISTLSVTSPS